MAKKNKPTDLDSIPMLDDVVSLGKVKKTPATELDFELEPSAPSVKKAASSGPEKQKPLLSAPVSLSKIQQAEICTMIDKLIQSKMKIMQAELSSEIRQHISNYLQDHKSGG